MKLFPFSAETNKSSNKREEERDALIVLNGVPGFTNRRILSCLERFGSARAVLGLSCGDLAEAGLPHQTVHNLRHALQTGFLERQKEALAAQGCRVLTIVDEEYPSELRKIVDPPVALYIKGDLPQLERSLAIVGSRRASLYGITLADNYAEQLAEMGVTIVSGLAAGIDTAAHKGCLRAGGKTVAVLGCGLDFVYPSGNERLYQEIPGHGCLVSEFPFGTLPSRYHFPRRNRVVSGLSLGVLVVEAGVKSGALITAQFAVEQGKDVFAVPGRVDTPGSIGPLALIREGAKLVMTLDDVLEELPLRNYERSARDPATQVAVVDKQLTELEKRLLIIIDRKGEASCERLEEETGLPWANLVGPLLNLQIMRFIKERPGKRYERSVSAEIKN